MQSLSCARCERGALELFVDPSGAELLFCTRCKSTFCRGEQVGRWLGAELPAASVLAGLPPLDSELRACPTRDGGALQELEGVAAGSRGYRCNHCGALLVEAGALPALRKLALARAPRARPSERVPETPPSPAPAIASADLKHGSDRPLHGDRLPFHEPWIDLLALPLALLSGFAWGSSWFGALLLVPVQIQFHELGHALVAWLSSRAALPLPFGFTFWREEPSRFTGFCMLFLIGVFLYHGLRERRRFAVSLGTLLLVLFAALSWFTPAARSHMLILLSGILGELTLTTLLMVAFYFPLPDRLRWDFFRFLALVPAAGAWVASARLWFGVSRGTRSMPMGSIIGTPGDGSGDLDRLIAHYGYTPAGLTKLYLTFATLTGLVLAATYAWFALRALVTLRRAEK